MTDTTTTALSPEELAARIELVGTEAAQEEIRQDIAAAIRQHSAHKDRQIEALEEANERAAKLLTADLSLLRMGPSELGFTMETAGRMVAVIAGQLATWLEEHHAENYTETAFEQIDISSGARSYVLTVQRGEGKSPHQLRKEAEAALSASLERERGMREALEKILNAVGTQDGEGDYRADDREGALDFAECTARAALQPQEATDER